MYSIQKKIGIISDRICFNLFGKAETFENDNLSFLYSFGNFLCRNTINRVLSEFICLFWIFLVLDGGTYLSKENSTKTLCKTLPFWGIAFSWSMVYLISVRSFPLNEYIISVQREIYEKYWKVAPHSLIIEMQKINRHTKIMVALIIPIIITFYYIYSDVILGQEIVVKTLKIIASDHYWWAKTFYFALIFFIIPHSILYTPTVFLLCTYYLLHLRFDLKLLNWRVKEMLKDERKMKMQINGNNFLYHKKIAKDLLITTKFYLDFKKFYNACHNLLSFRMFIMNIQGGIVMGTISIALLYLPSDETLLYWIMFLVGFLTLILITEGVNNLQVESEQVLKNILSFKWYQWDVKNLKHLLMLIFITQEPIIITFSGLMKMNRIMIFKIYQVAYTFINFFRSKQRLI